MGDHHIYVNTFQDGLGIPMSLNLMSRFPHICFHEAQVLDMSLDKLQLGDCEPYVFSNPHYFP